MVSAELLRASVKVKGRVQGVGFRFYVQRLAQRYQATGWVRNQSDESVWVEVQGQATAIKQLLAELEQGPPQAHVRDVRTEWLPAIAGESDFQIRF